MTITIFRNIWELKTPYYSDLEKVLERIKTGASKELVEQIRTCENKEERNELKKKLPSIMFSGKFADRKSGATPLEHSGLIALDIDELGSHTVKSMSKLLVSCEFTHASFVSPSGKGFKVIVKIPADNKRHTAYYLGLEKYFKNQLGVTLDASGKNINRVCYESYDPELYFNPDSEIFKQYIEDLPESKNINTITSSTIVVTDEDKVIDRVLTWWKKNYSLVAGQRNQNIFQLAAALNRYGVSQLDAERVCSKFQQKDFTEKEIVRAVKNAYETGKAKHGTEVFEDKQKHKSIVEEIMGKDLEEAANSLSTYSEFEDFTPYELEKVAEEIQEEAKKTKPTKSTSQRVFWYYDDKGKPKIDIEGLISFINECGYWIYYPVKTPGNYSLIKIDNNIIRHVDTREVKKVVLDFIKKNNQNVIYNIVADKVKYFTEQFLNALPEIDPKILRDTSDTSFIPTPTGVYKITKDGVKKIDYVDLTEGYVWETQITDRDFEYLNSDKIGDFQKFAGFVAGSEQKQIRLATIIGYLLHNYKNPAESKGVFFYDKNISQTSGEAEGGSGKSLMIEAIKYIREVAPIPGDRVDFTRSFVFQEINESTQIAWVDELEKDVDMKKFFSRLTNGLPIEKKRQNAIFIPQEEAPKFVFTTNFKPKGFSGSHRRRRIDFGVSSYFNVNHTPVDEFGTVFFRGWSDEQWNLFFTYYLDCISLYLKEGVIEVQDSDDEYLTIASEFGRDFAQYWLEKGNLDKLKDEGFIYTKESYYDFLDEQDLEEKQFSLKKYYVCINKILSLYHINYEIVGKRDKRAIKIIK